jgi:hypothetical protein
MYQTVLGSSIPVAIPSTGADSKSAREYNRPQPHHINCGALLSPRSFQRCLRPHVVPRFTSISAISMLRMVKKLPEVAIIGCQCNGYWLVAVPALGSNDQVTLYKHQYPDGHQDVVNRIGHRIRTRLIVDGD